MLLTAYYGTPLPLATYYVPWASARRATETDYLACTLRLGEAGPRRCDAAELHLAPEIGLVTWLSPVHELGGLGFELDLAPRSVDVAQPGVG